MTSFFLSGHSVLTDSLGDVLGSLQNPVSSWAKEAFFDGLLPRSDVSVSKSFSYGFPFVNHDYACVGVLINFSRRKVNESGCFCAGGGVLMKYPSSYFRWNPALGAYQCECGAVLLSRRSAWYHINRFRKHAGRREGEWS